MKRLVSVVVALVVPLLVASCEHRYFSLDDTGGSSGSSSSNGGSSGGHSLPDLSAAPCTELSCQINHTCAKGGHTTVTGQLFAPNGTLPLYNAIVYIPSGPVEPFVPGVSCDRCDGKISGNPLASALTGPDGRFTLSDVPTGRDIPLVVQLGRWRRSTTIPAVADCTNTNLTDPELTRLPRNRTEGDIPQIAIATGTADPFECLLLKIGIDAAEVTAPDAAVPGRIHFYRATDAPGLDLSKPAPTADTLYSSLSSLLRYDVLLLPCEGGPFDKSVVNGQPLTPDPRTLLQEYVNAGGRLFSTHYSYDWLTYTGSPYNKIAAPTKGGLWPTEQVDDYNDTIAARLVLTFPKGADFARWLGFAGVSSPPNALDIDQGRHDITAVDPAYAQPWATFDFSPVGGGPGVMHFTFNTPLDPPRDDMGAPEYCGRVVFSDFHVTAGALANPSAPFPAACMLSPMTDQEKALAFMLFDLSSCVQQDSSRPVQ